MLRALLLTLKSNGFTVLGVVNPEMHLPEEEQAILSVFEGEILIIRKETLEGIKAMLTIKKMINQQYSDREIALKKHSDAI